MKLCVVSPGSGWILDVIASSIARAGGWAWLQLGTDGPAIMDAGRSQMKKPTEAEVFYYFDIQNCWGGEWRHASPNALHVGAFTHLDRDATDAFRPGWDKLDGIIHMCRRYEQVFLREGWYPRERMTVIPPFDATRFRMRPLRLGVCQRGGFPGKGDPFLFEALSQLPFRVRRHVHLKIKGSGWCESIRRLAVQMEGIKVVLDDGENPQDYERFYDDIDYLLVPSLWEGGPIAVAEALACGVPVIAANVGWVPEMLTAEWTRSVNPRRSNTTWESGVPILVPGCRTFPPGNGDALRAHVVSLVDERIERRQQVERMTWASYAQKLEAFVETLR